MKQVRIKEDANLQCKTYSFMPTLMHKSFQNFKYKKSDLTKIGTR